MDFEPFSLVGLVVVDPREARELGVHGIHVVEVHEVLRDELPVTCGREEERAKDKVYHIVIIYILCHVHGMQHLYICVQYNTCIRVRCIASYVRMRTNMSYIYTHLHSSYRNSQDVIST